MRVHGGEKPSLPVRSPAQWPRLSRVQEKLYLGNLDAKRDWGYAKRICRSNVVDAYSRIGLNDYVLPPARHIRCVEFVQESFGIADLDGETTLRIRSNYTALRSRCAWSVTPARLSDCRDGTKTNSKI